MAYSKQTWIDYPSSDATLITADKLSHMEEGIANADTSASAAQTKANSAYSLAETANNGLGGKVDKVTGKGLSTNDYDNTEKAEVAKVASKVDKVSGKGLSTNDYTDADKAEVAKVTNKANKTTIAELYDANAIYEVGYHVIYNEMLYVCKQECMNTPPPNEAYWEQVILANEVSSLSQSLNNQIKYKNLTLWSDLFANKANELLVIARGVINNKNVALSLLIPVVGITNDKTYWQISDSYNNSTSIHLQICIENKNYIPSNSGMYYGSSKIDNENIVMYYR